MESNCIFCKIVKKEIPSNIIWEDESHIAFLNIHPIRPGHTLVIPKKHYSYLFDIEDPDYSDIWAAAKQVSGLLKKAFKPKQNKVGVLVYGLDVDHTHIHLAPLDKSGDLSFSNAKSTTPEELKTTLEKIKQIAQSPLVKKL